MKNRIRLVENGGAGQDGCFCPIIVNYRSRAGDCLMKRDDFIGLIEDLRAQLLPRNFLLDGKNVIFVMSIAENFAHGFGNFF